nr:hypothetical protein [Tanacetum cinerariifolium]
METKDTLPSCSNSEAQQMQQIQDKAKKSCMVSFRQLHSHLKRLSQNDLQGSRTESGFKRAFATLSCQDTETFTGIMFLNVEQLEKQLDKEDFQEIESMAAFNVLETQFQMFITNRDYLNDEYVAMTCSYFIQYTGQAILEFRDTLIQHLESVKKTESKEQDTSSRPGNDAHDDVADIKPIYDEEPMDEVQTNAEINVFAIGQQHTDQPEFNNEGEAVQNAKECHDTFSTHYLPKEKEAASAKPYHMIASRNSRISSKNMTRFSSNDMVRNHYLEEAKTRTQERSKNSEPSLLHSARSQSTANGSKPMPRTNNQTSRIWPATKNSFVTTKTVPIAEHPRSSRNDSCVTKFLKETSVVQKKTMTLRSCLRWKPTGKIFKIVGLRWVPTGKIFTYSTTKVDSEPLNGSNADITTQYECERTLNLSAGLVPQPQKASDYDNPDPVPQRQDVYSSTNADVPSQQELDMLFGPLYDEFFNAGTNPSMTIPSTSAPLAHTNMHAEENNNDQAEEREHIPDDEFTNPFCATTQEQAESSSHNIGNSNVPTFNQPQVSEYRWTKDHPLEQVRGNPSRPV